MALKTDQRPVRRQSFVEGLEPRRMFSVVNVSPGNFLGAIAGSNPGDTISFAPGQYNLAPGSVPRLPGDRTYNGNGAVLQSDGSAFIDLGYSSNLTFTGFVLNGVAAKADQANGLSFTNNTVSNDNEEGFLTTGMTNSTVNNNTFTNLPVGVYGYPADNNSVDGNSFDYVMEPIHFSTTCSGMDISGNVITHATRIGIELQRSMSNMTVNNNYFADWLQQGTGGMDWHMAISCTTGGSGNAPYTDQGQNITISGNTLLQTGPAQNIMVWAKSAIEIMGYSNITISNNYSYDWGNLILNGAYCTVNSYNNVNIGGDISSPDSVPWPIAGVHSSNDRVYGLNDSNQPSTPSEPSAGASQQYNPAPTPAPAPAPAPTPAPQNTSAASQSSATPQASTPAPTDNSPTSATAGSTAASGNAAGDTGPQLATPVATTVIPSTIALLPKKTITVKKPVKKSPVKVAPQAIHAPAKKPAPAKTAKAAKAIKTAAASAAKSSPADPESRALRATL